MSAIATLSFRVPIERHDDALARFAVFPSSAVAAWAQTGTFVVDATMNGHALGYRSMVEWKDRDGWFIGLTEPACKAAGVDTGDMCEFVLSLVGDFVPAELAQLLKKDRAAARGWARLTAAAQRMLALNVAGAKQAATRARRAQKVIEGLKAKPQH